MIVVADTSPLNYLIQIGHIDVLRALYDRLLIQKIVHEELFHPGAPLEVRTWPPRFQTGVRRLNQEVSRSPRFRSSMPVSGPRFSLL
jgi:hypothetical protein